MVIYSILTSPKYIGLGSWSGKVKIQTAFVLSSRVRAACEVVRGFFTVVIFYSRFLELILGIVLTVVMFLEMCRLARCSGAWSEQKEVKLMDDQQEQDCASEDQETILINGVKENGKELNYST